MLQQQVLLTNGFCCFVVVTGIAEAIDGGITTGITYGVATGASDFCVVIGALVGCVMIDSESADSYSEASFELLDTDSSSVGLGLFLDYSVAPWGCQQGCCRFGPHQSQGPSFTWLVEQTNQPPFSNQQQFLLS